jgi:hypothetical protein
VVLGKVGEITKTEARRKLIHLITEAGCYEPDYLQRVMGKTATFNHVADKWEAVRLPMLRSDTQYAVPKLIRKHLRPFFGKIPVDSIKTGTINRPLSGNGRTK